MLLHSKLLIPKINKYLPEADLIKSTEIKITK